MLKLVVQNWGIGMLILISTLFIISKSNAQSLVHDDYAEVFVYQDTVFKSPFIDIDEWRDTPVRHRYVHGGFEGTETRFSFYFPSKEDYAGHFFQYITPFPRIFRKGQVAKMIKLVFRLVTGLILLKPMEAVGLILRVKRKQAIH